MINKRQIDNIITGLRQTTARLEKISTEVGKLQDVVDSLSGKKRHAGGAPVTNTAARLATPTDHMAEDDLDMEYTMPEGSPK